MATKAGTWWNDVLVGGAGNDHLYGYSGNDYMNGGAGDDRLDGGHGNDQVYGGRGGDTLIGGRGGDHLYGGDGDDTLFSAVYKSIYNGYTDHADADTDVDWMYGGDGNDTFYVSGGDDIVDGGDGNDVFHFDNFVQSDPYPDYDPGFFVPGDAIAHGGNGNDTFYGSTWGFHASSSQAPANATLHLYGENGDDDLHGGRGNDVLSGGSGRDHIDGDYGRDVINGGSGDDFLRGGPGADTFVFWVDGPGSSGHDRIYDFQVGPQMRFGPAPDRITIVSSTIDSFADVMSHTTEDRHGNTVIDFGHGNTLTLVQVHVADLHASDFIFV
jgi:Ca2+-binding RTX toxin-like protein